MAIRRALATATALALLACTPGTSGPMAPLASPGLTLTKATDGASAAQAASNGVTVTVSGRWTDRGAQQLTLAYANRGSAAASIALTGLTLARGNERAPLDAVTDVSAAARPGYDPDRDAATLVAVGQPATPLALAPGATRTLTADFGAMPSGRPVERDQRLTARIATPRGAVVIQFDTRADGWF